jgi:hypothetical protein
MKNEEFLGAKKSRPEACLKKVFFILYDYGKIFIGDLQMCLQSSLMCFAHNIEGSADLLQKIIGQHSAHVGKRRKSVSFSKFIGLLQKKVFDFEQNTAIGFENRYF